MSMVSAAGGVDSVHSLPNVQQITEMLLRRVEISEPPVQLDKVLSVWKNVQVIEDDLDGAGYLLHLGDLGAEILVNKNNSDERRAFTVAHELGHWVLGLMCEKKIGQFTQPPGVSRAALEKWCDEFATNLLMPAHLINSWLPKKDQPLLINAVLQASKKFRVSEEAVFIRVWELQRIQVVMLKLLPTLSIERAYADPACNRVVSKLFQDADICRQLQMADAMIYFTLMGASGRVSVSGKKLGTRRAVLAFAWPD